MPRVQPVDAAQRQSPAVAGTGQESRQNAKEHGLAVEVGLDPAVGRGHPSRAEPSQRVRYFQIRVRAGEQPPQDLEYGLLGEHQAGVALLRAENPAIRNLTEEQGRTRLAHEPQRTSDLLLPDACQQDVGQLRIMQRVVARRSVQVPDQRAAEAGRQLSPVADEQLKPGRRGPRPAR